MRVHHPIIAIASSLLVVLVCGEARALEPPFLIGTTLHLGAEIRVIFAEETAGIFAGNIGAVF